VLLYELLTGKTPFDAKRLIEAGLDEVRRIIREEDPPRPSTRISTLDAAEQTAIAKSRHSEPPKLLGLIRGDLDWIVMQALEKDRTRRYETANGLASDILRHLKGETVTAVAPTLGYRVTKFALRHQAALAGAATLVACLLLATIFSTWQAIEAQRAKKAERTERLRAEEQRQRAEKGEAQFRHLHYVATMNQIQQAWERNNIALLRSLLEQTQDYPDRGFEWYYWQRQCHLETLALHVHAPVLAVAVSPDSRWIATGDCDNTTPAVMVTIWDAASGKKLRTLRGHPALVENTVNIITCIAFSPDSQRLVTGSYDHAAKVWDVASGVELFPLIGHTKGIASVAFSQDGRSIVSASNDRTARVWDAVTGRESLVLHATNSIESAQFSPDSTRIVTTGAERIVGANGHVSLWNGSTGKELFHFTAGGSSVGSACVSPDGKRIATAGNWESPVKIWDLVSGQQLLELKGHNHGVRSIAFSPDGQRLVTSGDGLAKVWDASTGRELLSLKGHKGGISCVAFFQDSHRVATSSWDETVKVWDVDAPPEFVRLRGGSELGLQAAAFSPDCRRVVTRDDKTVCVWSVDTGHRLLVLSERTGVFPFHPGQISCLAFSPNGQDILAAGLEGGTARLWNAASGQQNLTIAGSNFISAVAFSPDGTRVATANGYDVAVRVATHGQQVLSFAASRPEGPDLPYYARHSVRRLAFLGDGKRIATIGGTPGVCGNCKVWDAFTGKQSAAFDWIGCDSIAVSPDGRTMATAGNGDDLKLWNAQDGKLIASLKGASRADEVFAFSPDGQRVITDSDNQTLQIWDTVSGRELLTLPHTTPILSLAVSPDGKRLVACGKDRSLTTWQAATPEEVAAWREQEK
jgi:WD40 repeat protein